MMNHFPSVTPNDVISGLRKKHLTIAFAESCTGGRLAADLTTVPGSSEVVLGSAVCYRMDMKEKVLGLVGITQNNVVTPTTAIGMARSVQQLYGADFGVSTTGWLDGDPNGAGAHAYYAMTTPSGIVQARHQVFSPRTSRDQNREQLIKLVFGWIATVVHQDSLIPQ